MAVAVACSPGTWEEKEGQLKTQGHPELRNKFKASLGHFPKDKPNQNKSILVAMQPVHLIISWLLLLC